MESSRVLEKLAGRGSSMSSRIVNIDRAVKLARNYSINQEINEYSIIYEIHD